MTLWHRILTFVLAFSFLALAGTASAQEDKKFKPFFEELPTKALKDAWAKGRDLRADERWAEARVQFEAVYRETKNPRALYSIGICWKETGYFAQAIGTWEKSLASRDKLPKKEIDRAENAIKVVAEYVTTLTLKTNQTGATLFIKNIEIGKTPFLSPIPIDQGPNKIELRKNGFETVVRNVDVPAKKPLELEMNMVPADKLGKVTINVSGPENAIIYMDGGELGPSPYTGEVAIGERTFRAEAKGFIPGVQKVKVEFGKEITVTISMAVELNEGKVKVTTDHPDAEIRISGDVKGKGSWEGVLHEGGYALEISKDGYVTYKSDISVSNEQERVIDVKLEKDMTSYWVYWAVTGVVIAGGAGVASYFVLRPSEEPIVTGTLAPGTVETSFGGGLTLFSF